MWFAVDWVGKLAWVAGVIVSITVIAKYVIQPMWRFGVKFARWMDRIEAVMRVVEEQLLPSRSGSHKTTLKDQINMIDTRSQDTYDHVKSLDERLARMEIDHSATPPPPPELPPTETPGDPTI